MGLTVERVLRAMLYGARVVCRQEGVAAPRRYRLFEKPVELDDGQPVSRLLGDVSERTIAQMAKRGWLDSRDLRHLFEANAPEAVVYLSDAGIAEANRREGGVPMDGAA